MSSDGRRASWIVALMVVMSAASLPAAAQDARGAVRGRVVDAQGAALPGVAIVAKSPNVPGTFSAPSDVEGAYRLLNLPAASEYHIVAELDGFARFERIGLDVRAGLNLRSTSPCRSAASRRRSPSKARQSACSKSSKPSRT